MDVPVLETERLVVREFEPGDLEAVHELLDVELGPEGALTREERHEWLTWTVLGYRQLAQLHQPPYGDRAIVLKETGRLVGACGYTPVLDALGQIPSLRGGGRERPGLTSSEVGLYYALAPAHRGRGYATEAARALVDHAFARLQLTCIVATTTFDNAGSVAVMRRLGMRIDRNPHPNPPWLQVVGVLDHPEAAGA
ncbi:MAG: GNAT family N-acetyltransferase [Chloroflexota bacterium]|nr:GNAT family N-acetyltransferase [Chloroflexota bacterium]